MRPPSCILARKGAERSFLGNLILDNRYNTARKANFRTHVVLSKNSKAFSIIFWVNHYVKLLEWVWAFLFHSCCSIQRQQSEFSWSLFHVLKQSVCEKFQFLVNEIWICDFGNEIELLYIFQLFYFQAIKFIFQDRDEIKWFIRQAKLRDWENWKICQLFKLLFYLSFFFLLLSVFFLHFGGFALRSSILCPFISNCSLFFVSVDQALCRLDRKNMNQRSYEFCNSVTLWPCCSIAKVHAWLTQPSTHYQLIM